jgi:hypothetical protein
MVELEVPGLLRNSWVRSNSTLYPPEISTPKRITLQESETYQLADHSLL